MTPARRPPPDAGRPAGRLLAVLAALAAAGCATGAGYTAAPGSEGDGPGVGTARAAGVSVTARPGVWSGRPATLDDVVPVLVTVRNDADRPLRIRYDAFSLSDASGRRPAVDPRSLTGRDVELRRTGREARGHLAAFTGTGFRPAADALRPDLLEAEPRLRSPGVGHLRHGLVGLSVFDFGRRPGFGGLRGMWLYGLHGGSVRGLPGRRHGLAFARADVHETLRLPTLDMLRKAVPEGRLEPGGSFTGWVYFPEEAAGPPETAGDGAADDEGEGEGEGDGRVRLRLELLDDGSGEAFGRVRIDFRREG